MAIADIEHISPHSKDHIERMNIRFKEWIKEYPGTSVDEAKAAVLALSYYTGIYKKTDE